MKTASRHHFVNTSRSRYKTDKTSEALDPDRIILPVQDTQGADHVHFRSNPVLDYTEFEEIQTGSSAYDEMAFQEFAEEDPTRLRVADRF